MTVIKLIVRYWESLQKFQFSLFSGLADIYTKLLVNKVRKNAYFEKRCRIFALDLMIFKDELKKQTPFLKKQEQQNKNKTKPI